MRRDHHMRKRQNGGEAWFFQIAIPADLRAHYQNKKTIEKSLSTKDPAHARLKRDAYLVQQRAEFEHKRKTAATAQSQQASLDHAAMMEAFAKVERNPLRAVAEETALDYALTLDGGSLADMEAHARYRSGQRPAPLPRSESIDSFLAEFLSRKNFSRQHEAKTRRAVAKFAAWLESRGTQPILGNVTREVVGDYLVIVPGGWKTQVNTVGLLSSYFTWLHRPRGKLDANPFEGLGSEIEKPENYGIRKRPYTDEELGKLLGRPAGAGHTALLDTIEVLALSGMRASELCSLTMADSRGGVFRVHGGPDDDERRAKTKAAKRDIPIHTQLAAMIEQRCNHKDKPGLLFPEWKGSAHALGKVFHKHRLSRGVDDHKRGERQSRVDIHSLRRWFAMRATQALTGNEK